MKEKSVNIFFWYFDFFLLFPLEANLLFSNQSFDFPYKELPCPCRLRGDAGFEPGTAGWQSGALPLPVHPHTVFKHELLPF